jgi:glutathionylspermidine synthase
MKLENVFVYKTQPKVRLKLIDNYNKKQTVFIEPCYESYEQYGATTDVLWKTIDIAEWLPKTNYFRNFGKVRKGDGHRDWIKEQIENRFIN